MATKVRQIFFLIVNSDIYLNTHENSNINILNRVYNTLYNQSTTKGSNFCSYKLGL